MTDFRFRMRVAKKAALAGQDVEMPFVLLFVRGPKGLVEGDEVPPKRDDAGTVRVLRQLHRRPGSQRRAGCSGRPETGRRAMSLERFPTI